MKISSPCVVALAWTLQDSLGETLDKLNDPVEFLVGGDDLLPAIETALQGHEAGATLNLNLEPEDAFGDYDERLVFLLERSALPEGIEEGMLIEPASLPVETFFDTPPTGVLTITDLYPEHAVLDGNHPLAGIGLRLHLRVVGVREASVDEVGRGSAGAGFFHLQPMASGGSGLH